MKPSARKWPPEFASPLPPVNFPTRRCSVTREAAFRRVLIMRLGGNGDILMGTPLLHALRDAWPDAHLTWIVETNAREAIDAHPDIDELLLWDSGFFKRLLRRANLPLWLLRAVRLRREMRRRDYDIFISFQPEEWPLLALGSGARVRIGVFDTFRQFNRDAPTSRLTRFYAHAYAHPDLPPHRADQYLLPLRALNLPAPADKQMRMGFTDEDAAFVERFLAERGLTLGAFVILAPMTTWPSRCWPAERYVELGDRLTEETGAQIVLIGSAGERESVEKIANQMQTTPPLACGALTFRQMAALTAGASVVVSGDTGPMHVAAAVGTPFVALFGPTPVAGRAPLAGRGRVLMHPVPCGPCDQKICPNPPETQMLCLRLVSVDEVLTATQTFLPTRAAGR